MKIFQIALFWRFHQGSFPQDHKWHCYLDLKIGTLILQSTDLDPCKRSLFYNMILNWMCIGKVAQTEYSRSPVRPFYAKFNILWCKFCFFPYVGKIRFILTFFNVKIVINVLVFNKINLKTHQLKLNVPIVSSRHRASKLALATKYLSNTRNSNIFIVCFSCSSTARIASYLHTHLVLLGDFSDRDNNSPSASTYLKEATLSSHFHRWNYTKFGLCLMHFLNLALKTKNLLMQD